MIGEAVDKLLSQMVLTFHCHGFLICNMGNCKWVVIDDEIQRRCLEQRQAPTEP